VFSYDELSPYIIAINREVYKLQCFSYIYMDHATNTKDYLCNENYVHIKMPLFELAQSLIVVMLCRVVCTHHVKVNVACMTRQDLLSLIESHHCAECNQVISIFLTVDSKPMAKKTCSALSRAKINEKRQTTYQTRKMKPVPFTVVSSKDALTVMEQPLI